MWLVDKRPFILRTAALHFYSWVAINRGLRLAEKRSLPCPNRLKWMMTMDEIYEEVMDKGWNKEGALQLENKSS